MGVELPQVRSRFPLLASMNFAAGQTIANAVLVPLGGGGINVFARVTTDLVIGVNGYFDTGAAADGSDGAHGFDWSHR